MKQLWRYNMTNLHDLLEEAGTITISMTVFDYYDYDYHKYDDAMPSL